MDNGNTPLQVTPNSARVILRRYAALRDAIAERSWDDVEWHFDHTLSALQRELGGRERLVDRLR